MYLVRMPSPSRSLTFIDKKANCSDLKAVLVIMSVPAWQSARRHDGGVGYYPVTVWRGSLPCQPARQGTASLHLFESDPKQRG